MVKLLQWFSPSRSPCLHCACSNFQYRSFDDVCLANLGLSSIQGVRSETLSTVAISTLRIISYTDTAIGICRDWQVFWNFTFQLDVHTPSNPSMPSGPWHMIAFQAGFRIKRIEGERAATGLDVKVQVDADIDYFLTYLRRFSKLRGIILYFEFYDDLLMAMTRYRPSLFNQQSEHCYYTLACQCEAYDDDETWRRRQNPWGHETGLTMISPRDRGYISVSIPSHLPLQVCLYHASPFSY